MQADSGVVRISGIDATSLRHNEGKSCRESPITGPSEMCEVSEEIVRET